jgi:hypothetical protein
LRIGHVARTFALVAVALCILASAAAALARTAGDRPVGELRDCRTRGEGRSPQKLPPTPGVRIGPLVLWPSIRIRQRGSGNGTEWPFVQKVPVILPARTKVVLAIAPEAQGVAGFQHLGAFVSAIRFVACRERAPAFAYAGTVGKLTGFPFAIGLKRRSACVPMEVWVDGRANPYRRLVPVGRPSC